MDNRFFELNNGIKMPAAAFGTFLIEDGKEVKDAVTEALKIGYRHIDTAALYGNEKGIGEALKESGVPREEIFLVSKIWNDDQGYEKTKKAFYESLERLQTDYLDMYLIHWPLKLSVDTWRAMEELYEEGKIRAIGVSNFKENHLEDILRDCKVIPAVNQVELHPQFPQNELQKFCDDKGIKLTSWASLMQGGIFKFDLMKELGDKYNKTIAQITLRWAYQRGITAISKSVNPERIKNNFDIFGFEISPEDMKKIDELNTGVRVGLDPDDVYC